jgi:alpha-ketoglutarate-dependent taurine dioxygenase
VSYEGSPSQSLLVPPMAANTLTVCPLAPWRPRLASTSHALALAGHDPLTMRLVPFGVSVDMGFAGASLFSIPLAWLHAWVRAHRVLLLRGFDALGPGELAAFGRTLGEVDDEARDDVELCVAGGDHCGADGEVRMHWDEVAGRSPRYLLFCCEAAPSPGAGGEALFCDTTRVLDSASAAERTAWSAVRIRRGGAPRGSIVRRHPLTGEAVLRYVEPPDDDVAHLHAGEPPRRLRRRLYDPRLCYAHSWRDGDMLMADNDVVLHGRAALGRGDGGRVRRVNVFSAPGDELQRPYSRSLL